ncbi:MAG TPA: TonB-dependent siderophore receptor, partial [Pseudomonas sp.]|nr:TonB-dependent siderophore receptor [Pseudomonas sp.]
MAKIHRQQPGTRALTPLILAAALQGVPLAATGLALLPLPALAAAEVRDYRVPAGPLTAVLARFAATAGVQLVFDPAPLAGRSSPGLQGRYTLD